jgi:hypothetical protein
MELMRKKSKNRLPGAGNQEPLISPSTVAQVREHIQGLVKALSARTPTGETVELKDLHGIQAVPLPMEFCQFRR